MSSYRDTLIAVHPLGVGVVNRIEGMQPDESWGEWGERMRKEEVDACSWLGDLEWQTLLGMTTGMPDYWGSFGT